MALTDPVERQNILWLTIVAGIFRQKVSEGTPGAISRNYIYKEESCTKHEIHHKNLKGHLRGIEFKDGDFGQQCVITILNGEDVAKLTLPTTSRYFIDFAKKVTTCELTDEISMNPFDFMSKPINGKAPRQITGVTIRQGAAKLGSRYWDGSKSINGAPSPQGDTNKYDSDDWKYFFVQERKFLVNELTEFNQLIEGVEISDGLTPMDEIFPSNKPTPKKVNTAPNLDLGIEGKI